MSTFDIYVRVSKVGGRHGERYASPEMQEAACRVWATHRDDVTIGEVVVDEDVSGRLDADERLLGKLIRRIETGISSGVLVQYLDRFSRDLIGSVLAQRRIEEAGGRLVAVDDGYDSADPNSWDAFAYRQVTGDSYLRRVRKTFLASQKRAAERGVYLAGGTPTGYRRTDDRRIEPDPSAAPLVVRAFEMRAAGSSFPAIREMFAEAGVELSTSTVRKMIARRVYLGENVAQSGIKGQPRIVPDSHEPLVTAQLWDRANGVRQPWCRQTGELTSQVILGGLVYCASCSSRMHASGYGPAGAKVPAYRCHNRVCTARSIIRADRLEAWVEKELGYAWRVEPGRVSLVRNEHVERRAKADDAYATAAAQADRARDLLDTWRTDTTLMAEVGMDAWRANLASLTEGHKAAQAELAAAGRDASDDVNLDDIRYWQQPGELTVEGRRIQARRYVRAVYIRPAAKRTPKGTPVADRVERIVYVGQELDDVA